MITAKEAKMLSDSYLSSRVTEELELIHKGIEQVCREGGDTCYYYGRIDSRTINKLRDLGYNVNVSSYMNEDTTTIEW